jgi:hypothetical protein
MFGYFFTDDANPSRRFAQVSQCDLERFKTFYHGMLDEGVYLAPSAFETGFVSSAHTDEDIDNTIVEKDTLLDRIGNAESVLGQDDHFSVLRKGAVELKGVGQAQEWLITQTTDQGVRGHYFNLEANSTLKASEFPYLDISFRNGDFPPREPHKELSQASLTDAEAAGLWDAITRSFRARPGAF